MLKSGAAVKSTTVNTPPFLLRKERGCIFIVQKYISEKLDKQLIKGYTRVIMKYKLKDKQARNKKLYEYSQAGYTLKAIAGIFHISTTMVWKIVHRMKRQEKSNGRIC